MKKIFLFLTVLFLIFSNTGCDPSSYYFDCTYYDDQIEKIELRYVESIDNPTMITIANEEYPSFRLDNSTLLETLDEKRIHDYIVDFSKITFHRLFECCKEPFGYIAVMHLKNSNYIAVSCSIFNGKAYDLFCEFDNSGMFVQCFGTFASFPTYEKFLNNYFGSYVNVSK